MRRPRLRSLLLAVNVVILLLPLGGVTALRLYESALVRQTESELIGQAAFLAAAARAALARAAGESAPDVAALDASRWRPRGATLDLAVDDVRPRAPESLAAAAPAGATAVAAGAELLPIMRDAQVVTLAAIRVVDANGVIVASTGDDHGRSIAHYEEIGRALAGETVSLLRERISDEPPPALASLSRGTGIRVFVAMPIGGRASVDGAVLLSRTPRSLGQTLYGKRAEIALGGAVLVVAMLALTLFTALTIRRPLERLLDQARRAARGERGAVVPLARPVTADVAELSDGVAAMARALEGREEYLRDFASQVSHELKTPLAALRGALELLVDHGETMTLAERSRFFANLAGDVDRLERLVRRLLDLARADVMKPAGEACDAAAVAAATVARRHGDAVDLRIEAAALPAAIGAEALETAIDTLLDNARQHAGPAARVSLIGRRAGDAVEIVVADDGSGVAEANRGRIFEPFFTTARASGGTGLGLAILRSLMRAHDGTIDLEPSKRGARFRLRIPAA